MHKENYTSSLLTKSYMQSSEHHWEFTKAIKQDYKNNCTVPYQGVD